MAKHDKMRNYTVEGGEWEWELFLITKKKKETQRVINMYTSCYE